jgi:hypothetical protein
VYQILDSFATTFLPAKDKKMWRFFAPHVEEFSAECARNGESTEKFTVTGNPEPGSSGAVPVKMESGRRAWVKPAGKKGDAALVGRERLAFVLGNRFKLPIAPVLITRQTSGHAHDLPTMGALSFATLGAGKRWDKLSPAPSPDEIKPLKASFTALHVFHTWIDDHDHRGSGWNFDGERDPDGTIHTSFYDYGHSLTHEWKPPEPPPTRNWANFEGVYAEPCPLALAEIIAQIQVFPLAELEAMVSALPLDCMPPGEGAALASALHERGKQLGALLKFTGTP